MRQAVHEALAEARGNGAQGVGAELALRLERLERGGERGVRRGGHGAAGGGWMLVEGDEGCEGD